MAVEIGGGHRLDGAHGVEPVEPLGHVAGGQLLDGGLVVATLASDVFHYPRIAVNNPLYPNYNRHGKRGKKKKIGSETRLPQLRRMVFNRIGGKSGSAEPVTQPLILDCIFLRRWAKNTYRNLYKGISMGEWLVELRGPVFDLRDLADLFTTPDLLVVQEGEEFRLKSTAFDALASEDEVYAKAKSLMPSLNGIASVYVTGYRNVGMSGGIRARSQNAAMLQYA
jgi:hypothetical protein